MHQIKLILVSTGQVVCGLKLKFDGLHYAPVGTKNN